MSIRLHRSAAILLGVTASIFAGAPRALAQDRAIVVRGVAPGNKMVVVSYRDLNLNYEAQRDILYDRVGNAVRDVCNFDQVRGPGTDYRTCSSKAWTGTLPQMYRAFIQAYQRAYPRRR
jgi:UrcA family protein